MVFGPAMDIATARKEGTTPLQVLMRGNRLISSQLSLRVKLLFWLTNGPYWMLAIALVVAAPLELPSRCGPSWLHALAVFAVALASSAFHGTVLFGGRSSIGTGRYSVEQFAALLLAVDMTAANCYGLALALMFGLVRSLLLFAFPIALLMCSAYTKRKGRPVLYAFLHGTWHVLSAAAMWRILYFNDQNVRGTIV